MPLHIKTKTIINYFYFSVTSESSHYIDVFLFMCIGGCIIYEFHFKKVKTVLENIYYKKVTLGLIGFRKY